jgi:hypothetical protein
MPSQQSVSIARLYSRPLIRVVDYLAFLEPHTYDGARTRPLSSALAELFGRRPSLERCAEALVRWARFA